MKIGLSRWRRNPSEIYFDREAGIVHLLLVPDTDVEHSEKTTWGLIDRDSSDRPVGVEIWDPNKMFPQDLLDVLPPPIWAGERKKCGSYEE